MTSFNWLHLTDLHQGIKEEDWLWPGVKDIFFEDLQRLHEKSGPWDLVLFTGDLTQKGSKEEFDKLEDFLGQLWTRFKMLGSTPKLLAVPGNHDLVRPDEKKPLPASLRLLLQWDKQPDIHAEFWNDDTSPYRQSIEQAFSNYVTWWEKQPYKIERLRTGILPGDFSASLEKGGAKLGIVGLNTSFLQLNGNDHEGRLVLHTRQFHEACGGNGPDWTKQHHACLFLTHHPPAWLTSDAQQHLTQEIISQGRFAAHLCGHMHKVRYQNIADGSLEIRCIWQGRSLCGLGSFKERDGSQQIKRQHGYTAGKIELDKDAGKLFFWPREDRLQGDHRSIVPDFSVKLDEEEHTAPKNFKLLQLYVRPGKNELTGSPSENMILYALYHYYLSNPDKPEMTLQRLYETIGLSLDDRKKIGQVHHKFFLLEKKGWAAKKPFANGLGDPVEITIKGIEAFLADGGLST